jgi:hypothetical protein
MTAVYDGSADQLEPRPLKEVEMSAYLSVHRREITDSEALRAYGEDVSPTIAKFGEKVLVRSVAVEGQ